MDQIYEIETKFWEMVPIGTMPEIRDQLVNTVYYISEIKGIIILTG